MTYIIDYVIGRFARKCRDNAADGLVRCPRFSIAIPSDHFAGDFRGSPTRARIIGGIRWGHHQPLRGTNMKTINAVHCQFGGHPSHQSIKHLRLLGEFALTIAREPSSDARCPEARVSNCTPGVSYCQYDGCSGLAWRTEDSQVGTQTSSSAHSTSENTLDRV